MHDCLQPHGQPASHLLGAVLCSREVQGTNWITSQVQPVGLPKALSKWQILSGKGQWYTLIVYVR